MNKLPQIISNVFLNSMLYFQAFESAFCFSLAGQQWARSTPVSGGQGDFNVITQSICILQQFNILIPIYIIFVTSSTYNVSL